MTGSEFWSAFMFGAGFWFMLLLMVLVYLMILRLVSDPLVPSILMILAGLGLVFNIDPSSFNMIGAIAVIFMPVLVIIRGR